MAAEVTKSKMEPEMPKAKVKPGEKREREISSEESAEEEEIQKVAQVKSGNSETEKGVQELEKEVMDFEIDKPFSDQSHGETTDDSCREEEDDSDDPEDYKKKEYTDFMDVIKESRGYDVPPPLPSNLRVTVAYERVRNRRSLIRYAKIAINKYNKRNRTEYVFNRVIKGNRQTDQGLIFYITFVVKDHDAKPIDFQAKVLYGAEAIIVMECHPKAMPPADDQENENYFSDHPHEDGYTYSIEEEQGEDYEEEIEEGLFAPSFHPYYGIYEVEEDYETPAYIQFAQAINDSRGYDVPDRPAKLRVNVEIVPTNDMRTMKSLAKIAIKKYNKKYGTEYVFDHVIKGNQQVCRGLRFYITFVVKGPDGNHIDFQAKVIYGSEAISVEECQPKPMPTTEDHLTTATSSAS